MTADGSAHPEMQLNLARVAVVDIDADAVRAVVGETESSDPDRVVAEAERGGPARRWSFRFDRLRITESTASS